MAARSEISKDNAILTFIADAASLDPAIARINAKTEGACPGEVTDRPRSRVGSRPSYSRLLISLCALALVLLTSPLAPTAAAAPKSGSSGYHVAKTITLGGDEGWDYVAIDSDARRVYVSHGSRVVVLDADSGALIGEIPDTQGVHGIAVASDLGRGFTSNGRANTVTIFDLKTLKPLGTIKVGMIPTPLSTMPAPSASLP